MRVVLQRLEGLDVSHVGGQWAGDAPHPFFRAVEQAELQRVHTQLFAQLVDGGLHGECGGGGAGSPVGCRLGQIDDHVHGLDVGVGYVVLGHHALGAGRHGGAGESAGLVDQVGLGGDEAALFGGSQLDLDPGGRGRSGGLEDLGAAHLYLHRAARLPGQEGGHRFHVDDRLGPEAAANLQWNGLNVGNGNAHETGGVVADREMALAAGPDGQLAIGLPVGGAGVGLDVALMHWRRGGLFLDDNVGVLEALVDVAQAEFEVIGDVGGRGGVVVVPVAAGPERRVGNAGQLLVEDGGAGLHAFLGVEHWRQRFVVDLDQRQGLFSDMGVGGGHTGDGVPLVEHLAAGQHVGAEEAEVLEGAFRQVAQLAGCFRPVGRGHNRKDSGERFGGAAVDGLDYGVGVRAAEYLAVDQAGEAGIGPIPRPPGNLVDPIRPDGARTDHVELFIGKHDVRLIIQHLLLPVVRCNYRPAR